MTPSPGSTPVPLRPDMDHPPEYKQVKIRIEFHLPQDEFDAICEIAERRSREFPADPWTWRQLATTWCRLGIESGIERDRQAVAQRAGPPETR